jgi:hypothetical protein
LRPNSQDSTSIIPKDIPTGPYYCNLDNIRLDLQNKETGEYICPKCSTSYFPRLGEKVKRANKFETPSGPSQPILSLVDDSRLPVFTSNRKYRSHLITSTLFMDYFPKINKIGHTKVLIL